MDSIELSLDRTGQPFLDLTPDVRRCCGDVGGDGLLSVFAPHATAGVALFELGRRHSPVRLRLSPFGRGRPSVEI